MEQLKCPNCGGNIDRERMICPYCGTQFKREEYEQNILRIEAYNPQVEIFKGKIILDRRYVAAVGVEEASKMAVHEIARKVADSIAPFMELNTEFDARRLETVVSARVRILRPDYWF